MQDEWLEVQAAQKEPSKFRNLVQPLLRTYI